MAKFLWKKYHVHYGVFVLRVIDCVVTISFDTYLVMWLLQIVL